MIKTSALTFSFEKENPIVFPDLDISQNEHTLILGPSGCGKTTLLHLLSGLRKPSTGNIELLGTPLHSLSQEKIDQFRGKNIGMIFQVPHFIQSLNVLENLLLAQSLGGHKIDSKKCNELLSQLNIGDKTTKKTNELSVGELQRVAIARALVNEPKIIFADEPTSALDDNNTERVIEILKNQCNASQATLIVVTHDQRLKDNFIHKVLL